MACISEGSDNILRSRIEDVVRLCDKRTTPCYLGFLDLREKAAAQTILATLVDEDSYAFYGGYTEAERSLLAVFPAYFPPEDADYPLRAVAFHYRTQRQLTHRDVLGTLMSAGIRRDAIGDILCGDGVSIVFVRNEIADYICEQIDRIGGEGVRITPNYAGDLPIHIEYEPIHETVAAPRLDCIVKALIHCSREKAAELIRIGSVSVNHRPCESVSTTIQEQTTISIRGYGRYVIQQIGPLTKKGRWTLLAGKRL